jgi:DNA-binding MarR family transcriptional regulator
MQELAEAVHLSQSALSRVVARLEADGLVVRTMCASDRPRHLRCLTDPAASATRRRCPRTAPCWRRRSAPDALSGRRRRGPSR